MPFPFSLFSSTTFYFEIYQAVFEGSNQLPHSEMGKKGKSGNEKKKQAKKDAKNLNAQNLASLNRLYTALNELNANPSSSLALEEGNSTTNDGEGAVGLPLNHWKELPENVSQAYKMMSDGAEVIKATSTKYTLLGKIDLEDGSKYAVRQFCMNLIIASHFV